VPKDKPLEIFLYDACSDPACIDAKQKLSAKLKKLSVLLSQHARSLIGTEANVVLTNSRTIRSMNKEFRKVDGATDVLSFPQMDDLAAEVWLCPSVIKKNAQLFSEKYENELVRMVVHGFLHVAGFDHRSSFLDANSSRERMFQVQERIVGSVCA